MTKTMTLVAVAFAVLAMTACDDKGEQAADKMLEQASTQFEKGQYDQALHTIDSLRKAYPKAIDTRKKALELYQNIALKQAQDDLASTDTILQRVEAEYETMKAEVEKAKAELKATPDALNALTMKRMERDSLKVRFDMQCAKIKYIHKKQKE